MSFTIDQLRGYEAGKRYERELKFVRMFGNSGNRSIVMRDKDGVELLWSTTDYNNTYKNFKLRATYKFRVSHIVNVESMSIPQINIQRLTFVYNKENKNDN